MNTETIIHPKLQHVGLTTGRLRAMLDWYKKVLGMRLIYLSEDPTGDAAGSSLKAVWLNNDEANNRVAIIEIPGLTGDPSASGIIVSSTSPSSSGPPTNSRVPTSGSRLQASCRCFPSPKGRRRRSITRTRTEIASSSASTIMATTGHRSRTSRTRRSSLAYRLASSSILTRSWQRARRALPRGVYTGAPGGANLSRPSSIIRPPSCE